jgi:trimeric autotransporter adhesin
MKLTKHLLCKLITPFEERSRNSENTIGSITCRSALLMVVFLTMINIPSFGQISGGTTLCIGASPTTLTDPNPGGTWSSSNPAVATIGSASGIAMGIAPGLVTISYTFGATTETLVMISAPGANPITGYSSTCEGATTGLYNSTSGSGTWSSSNTAVGTIGTGSGVVTGISAGTTIITYSTYFGCTATRTQSVNAMPGTITGPTTICAADTGTFSCSPSGGTWYILNTGVATINSSTGLATGISAGTTTVSYSLGSGCSTTASVTTASQPPAIMGLLTLCPGGTSTLSSDTTGGTWTSSNSGVASVDVSTGLVTAASPGTATISYTGLTGCTRTAEFTVNAAPGANTGNTTVCVGGNITLSNSTSGGTWSSDNTGIATVGAGTGLVTGISSGNTNITYSIGATGCNSVSEVTVNASPAAIIGSTSICVGDTMVLTHPASGGTWSSNHAYRATVDSLTGEVIAVSVGLVTITYHISPTCYATLGIAIKALPSTITGSGLVCEGSSTTLSSTTLGGAWTSGTESVAYVNASTGEATGVSAGTTIITYSTTLGCLTTTILTVDPVPTGITGTPAACVGANTALSCATGGGTWSSSNTLIATVDGTTGVVTGDSSGTTTISYTIPSGCSSTILVSIGNLPATITGSLTLCIGGSTTVTDASSGGTWSSSDTSILTTGTAAITSTTLTGIGAGTADISYTVGGCAATATVTINAGPSASSGLTDICVGTTTTFTNGTSGGTWSSSAPAWASVDSATGIVTGVSAGVANISYITGTGCYAVTQITVSSTPPAITGNTTVCEGFTTTLSHATSGGTWSSSVTGVATIDGSTGVVSGIAAGTSIITYTVSAGCFTTTTVNVYGPPTAISGTTTLCDATAATFTNATSGGSWSSSNTSVGTIAASSGLFIAVGSGTTTITYEVTGTGCYTTQEVTVNPVPAAISGSSSMCLGDTITLSSATSGGSWSSTSAGVAPIDSATGIVVGNAGGASTISYSLPTGCVTTFAITVNNPPASISGTLSLCVSGTTTLSSATAGQTWSSSNTSIATVGSASATTGLVTATGAGTATISYTNAGGCARTTVVTVNAGLSANTGDDLICIGHTTALSNATSGGSWASSNTSVATVGYYSGVVSGSSAGTSSITYSVSGCTSVTEVTVNASPEAISGETNVCKGSSITLTHSTSGGTWTSSNSATASVDAGTGEVTGLNVGYAYITYSVSSSCYATKLVIVRPVPIAIYGPTSVAEGAYIYLHDPTSGGVWSSSNTAIASVIPSMGIVGGLSAGSATISYTISSTGCYATYPITVYATEARPSGSTMTSSAFKLYPNPSRGLLTITADTDGSLLLFSIDGRLVKRYTVLTGNNNISLPMDLTNGIYMCRFEGNDGSNKMVRLVIEK